MNARSTLTSMGGAALLGFCSLALPPAARGPGRAGWLRRAACDTIVNSTSVNRKRSEQDHGAGECMISGRRQTTEPGDEHHEPEGTHLGPSWTSHTKRRWARWSARRKRDAWVVLCVLLLGIGTVITLSAQPGTTPVGGTEART